MRAMGEVLERLVRRELVSSAASDAMHAELLGVWSSGNRVRGAVPESARVAHKTGTQRRRITDLAIVYLRDGTPLVLTIAVRDLPHEEAEEVLRAIVRRVWTLANEHAARAPKEPAPWERRR